MRDEGRAVPAGRNIWRFRTAGRGVELAVRLTPRGGLPRAEGIVEIDGQSYLRLRVPAPPVDGQANAALVECLAKMLRLPRSAVSLVAGERGRNKRLHLRGDDLPGRLAALLPASRPRQ